MNRFNLKQERPPHVHTIDTSRGEKTTSVEVVDEDDDNLHWHTINRGRTSTDAFGAGHVHIYRGEETSQPISADEA